MPLFYHCGTKRKTVKHALAQRSTAGKLYTFLVIQNNIIELSNDEYCSKCSIFIGGINTNYDLIKKSIKKFLQSESIYSQINSIQIRIISNFIEIEIDPGLSNSYDFQINKNV